MNAPVSLSEVWVKAASASSALLDAVGFDLAGRPVFGQDSAKDLSSFSTSVWTRLSVLAEAPSGLVGMLATVSGAAVSVIISAATPGNSDPAMATLYPGEKLSVGAVPDELAPSADYGPARTMVAITPDDDADIAGGPVRAIYVGTGGDLIVHDLAGSAVTLSNVQTGSLLPIYVRRVLETSTASGLVGMR